MSDHRVTIDLGMEYESTRRTHELLECIAQAVVERKDHSVDEHLQRIEHRLQALIYVGEMQNAKLARLIELMPRGSFPQATGATVAVDKSHPSTQQILKEVSHD